MKYENSLIIIIWFIHTDFDEGVDADSITGHPKQKRVLTRLFINGDKTAFISFLHFMLVAHSSRE